MPSFVINSRYVLLTYAQCGSLDPFDIVDLLATHHGECIIGREVHGDGGTHLHAFVDFGRKFRSRRADIFDVSGFHPNISPSLGHPDRGYDYATKDGDVVAGGLERPSPSGRAGDRERSSDRVWNEIIMAPTADTFWQLLREHQPRALCTSFVSLQKFAEWNYRVDPEPYEHDPGLVFNLAGYPALDRWTRENLRERSLGGGFFSFHS